MQVFCAKCRITTLQHNPAHEIDIESYYSPLAIIMACIASAAVVGYVGLEEKSETFPIACCNASAVAFSTKAPAERWIRICGACFSKEYNEIILKTMIISKIAGYFCYLRKPSASNFEAFTGMFAAFMNEHCDDRCHLGGFQQAKDFRRQ